VGRLACLRERAIQTSFFEAIALTIGGLFPIMNPFSTAPLFVSLTTGVDQRTQRREAFLACVYAFGILVVFLLLGTAIVDFFGISIPGIRAAGGLIITTSGFRMLFPSPGPGQTGAGPQELQIAFTPIAMPSLAGPGSIAVVLTAAAQVRSQYPTDWPQIYLAAILGMAVCVVIAFVVLRAASFMVRFLGRGGIDAMTRIFGFLLICIGMQFLLTGIDQFFGIRAAVVG
jgi:multiple antibiotic resistance protein